MTEYPTITYLNNWKSGRNKDTSVETPSPILNFYTANTNLELLNPSLEAKLSYAM